MIIIAELKKTIRVHILDDVNPYYFIIHSISLLVQSCSINPCVYATYDTEQYYAKCTQS